MASLSSEYILDDVEKEKTLGEENLSALHLSLYSSVGGSANPLLMTDGKDANKRPVVFDSLTNSWN